jgi:hypothetical protein
MGMHGDELRVQRKGIIKGMNVENRGNKGSTVNRQKEGIMRDACC